MEKAKLELAHKQDPEARAEVKRLGIEVGKRVRYLADGEPALKFNGIEHTGVVSKLHHKSVEIVMTGDLLGKEWADMILREDTIPYSAVLEVLGDGRLPVRPPPEIKKSPPPPPREKGYEECDIGDCTRRPVMAYLMRKYDEKIGQMGLPHIVAVCKDHDEKYVEAECKIVHDHAKNKGAACVCTVPAHIPLLWQMGVDSDSWRIPPPEGEVVPMVHLPPPRPKKADNLVISPPRPRTDSPYEGVKGRHPRLCDCSRHMPVK